MPTISNLIYTTFIVFHYLFCVGSLLSRFYQSQTTAVTHTHTHTHDSTTTLTGIG